MVAALVLAAAPAVAYAGAADKTGLPVVSGKELTQTVRIAADKTGFGFSGHARDQNLGGISLGGTADADVGISVSATFTGTIGGIAASGTASGGLGIGASAAFEM